MRMMGLTDSIMWLAWFIQRFCLVLVLSATVTIALMVSTFKPPGTARIVIFQTATARAVTIAQKVHFLNLQNNLD